MLDCRASNVGALASHLRACFISSLVPRSLPRTPETIRAIHLGIANGDLVSTHG